ncbi:BA75_04120T0 [Komagataella pastoris]|uniref:BA75_04120T0 n=1 Tax=Komagataella pastoris TaxID=4922 RepID=A0A1B2JF02_PICPA|nr:BA75_04120T0 [Komagataella pastoris]
MFLRYKIVHFLLFGFLIDLTQSASISQLKLAQQQVDLKDDLRGDSKIIVQFAQRDNIPLLRTVNEQGLNLIHGLVSRGLQIPDPNDKIIMFIEDINQTHEGI